jgi:aspartyl-tRNA(Asn)/glutamyl-tRNA(Gln) amidotransferase subunit C
VAELASLELSFDEEQSLLGDLNSILDYIGQLNELDTSTVAAMAQVGEVLGKQPDVAALRDDLVRPSLDRGQVMASAPDSDGIFFKVPKVIER